MSGTTSFIIGNSTIRNNTITAGDDGIYVDAQYWGYNMSDFSRFDIGSFRIVGNTIGCTYGIYAEFEYFGKYLNDSASFAMGSIEHNNNTINSSNDGISLEWYEFGYEMHNNSNFTMGNLQVNDNNITSENDGIYVYDLCDFGAFMYGNSSFAMGDVEFNRNTINASGYGVDFGYMPNGFGEYLYDNASFMMGNILFNENRINSSDDGIYCDEYLGYFGYYMYGNATFEMGNVEFNSNRIDSKAGDDMYWEGIEAFGYEMGNNASVIMGDFLFNDNTITCNGSGIYVNDFDDVGSEIHNSTNVTVGNITLNNNTITITSSDNGMYLHLYDFGINVSDTAIATFGEFLMDGNTITNAEYGIYFNETDNFTISNNTISDGKDGIYLNGSSNNTIEYNTIANNTAVATGAHVDELSNDNELHLNCFYYNVPQAMDNGTNNTFNSNFWDDWSGSGPYEITGTANNTDDNPLDECPLGEEPIAPPNITSFAPPSPVNDTVCHWTTFNVTVNQTVNVSWYLNNTPLHTNVSTKEANCTLHAEVAGEHNVSAVATNANGTDMQMWVWNVSSLDNDGDGVFNTVEDGAPNNGDGNGDGTPDRDQSNVTSLPTATNRGYMTLVLSNCTQLKNVTALTESPADPDYYYPYGLVSFEIMCENGTVEITYNGTADLAGYTYRKYGPTTPGNPETTKWYDFSTYATIAGNRVTLSFQDDRLGDDTGDDGVIVDQGGPGIPGAVAQVPALTPVGIIALVGLLSVVAAMSISIRKRK